MFFDGKLQHNGAAYDLNGNIANNCFLRLHMYVHWRGDEETDDIRSVHLPGVSDGHGCCAFLSPLLRFVISTFVALFLVTVL